ncbi:DUF6114 domain-containing protein [Actinacidiphila oryziradicis]|uniref:DUF6114 domain-containing protein n=1 Tax=Actinacidiphila oryziradicis TaxID=2571141 RepID=UPI001B8026A0|nr:DUF6114 domain-containing protein [Actinacidiphila oryziradicis]
MFLSDFRDHFRAWRRSRPFWAGVWTLLSGLEILSIPLAPVDLMIHEGIAGVSGLLMGIFLVILGLTMWLAPDHRVFAGIASLIFAVASLVLSNFGGFLIGFLLGILGGAMAVSWVQDHPDDRYGKPPVAPDWGGGSPTLTSPPGGPDDRGGPDAGDKAAPARRTGSAPCRPAPSGRRGSPSVALRGNRLRALGALPVGGALIAGGLQPMSPPAPPAHPGRPPAPADRPSDPQLSVCSLLDGLLGAGTGAQTGSGTGTGHTAQQPHPRNDGNGLHVGVSVPPLHGSLNLGKGGAADPHPTTVPGQRAAEPRSAAPGGLLGTVTGLLGLNGSPTPQAAPSPPRSSPSSSAPSVPRATKPHPGARQPARNQPTRNQPAPDQPEPPQDGLTGLISDLRLTLPPLPRDGGMDEPMSLLPLGLPLHLDTHTSEANSPWCLPQISLDLSLGAVNYADMATAAAQPFRVRTPLLVLTGLTYHGIAATPTRYGRQRLLVFTALRVDIASLRQTAPLLAPSCAASHHPETNREPPFHGLPGIGIPGTGIGLPGIGRVAPTPTPWFPCQRRLESDAAPWSTTTATGRPVVLLTRVLSGNLLGLLPVTFTPGMPPPLPPGLTVPIPLFFTGVTTYNQLLRADRLSVPGLHQHPYDPPSDND